jgi:hypothetical protein
MVATWACSGENPVTPGARVAAVLASRDSISFESGDSVLVQADPRDAMGNSVLEATIDWSSTDPGVATVVPNGRLAQVIAIGTGSGAITVTDGIVEAVNWPALLRAGDSIPIYLAVYDASHTPHPVTATTTFAMQVSGGLTFSDGARPINTITIPADLPSSPVFHVKGKTAGAASVWFVNVDYLQHVYQTNVH